MIRHFDDAIAESDFFDADPEDDGPRCSECGCDLFTDDHAFDCSLGDEEENDGDEN